MATVVNPALRPRDKRGCYVAGEPVYSAAQIAAEKRKRARQWRKFREDFLYSQEHLATALNCARRTVYAVEAGAVIPSLRLQRAFRDVVRAQKKQAA
jgi:DNA-binding XRE family transcriptional regulator